MAHFRAQRARALVRASTNRRRISMSKIADFAYQRVRDRNVSSEYPQGTHLKEELVAHDIGANRTPEREALWRLNVA